MGQKIILTTEQHEKVINSLLNEMVNTDENLINEDGSVNEGVWEKIKYGLSKLGRYKAGGKIFGKGKIDKEAAAKIQAIIDKKGNEVIKALDAEIKEKNPEFPNNEKGVEFLNTIMEISAVYDSIVASTNKKPEEEGYLPIDAANGIINDLREYVKKFLDVDLTAAYSVVDEAEGNIVELTEEELKALDEAWCLNETEEDVNVVIEEDEASDVRKALKAQRGDGADFGSDRMKTLKSNKLPLLLAGIGGALGGLSWLAQTEWFKNWLEGLLGADQTITSPDIIQDVTGGAPDSKGMLHWMGQIDGREMKTGADVQAFIDKFGADKVQHMFDGNGGGPSSTQIQQLQQLVGGDNASKSVGELFNPSNDTFGSMKGGQNLFGVSKAASFLAQIVIKKGATTLVKGAGTALAAKFAGLGAILGPIGVAILGTGALVKIMRMKGQKQSRAATLNDLYQSIRNIEGGAGVIEPEGETIDKGSAQDPAKIEDKNKEGGDKGGGEQGGAGGTGGKGGTNDELYNTLRNLFQFVVNNRKKLGTRSSDNVGTGGATLGGNKKAEGDTEFKKGDKVIYKGKNVTVTVPNVSPGYTQIDADGDGPEKKTYAVKTADLKKALSEGKYIKDKRLIQFLEKSLSMDKLKSFEEFISRVERIRNLLKKVNTSEDKVLGNFLKKLNSNPIMLTDFVKMFSIDSQNPQAVNALKAFIDDLFITLYSGKYKFDSMIDKMGKLGDGNVNKLEEEKGYSATEPNKAFIKDAQDRGRFKKNLMAFLTDAIGVFQYLHKLKKENNKNEFKSGEKKGGEAKPEEKKAVTPPSSSPDSESAGGEEVVSESSINPLINEEIQRIKKIMSGLI
jgi:hypothetical protein